MLKKKSDYMRMIEFGEWIEKLLSTDFQVWEIKPLFLEAINLLGLHFPIQENSPLFKEIEKLTLDVKFSLNREDIPREEIKQSAIATIFALRVTRGGYIDLFRKLIDNKMPWQRTLWQIYNGKIYDRDFVTGRLKDMIRNYRLITEKIVFTEDTAEKALVIIQGRGSGKVGTEELPTGKNFDPLPVNTIAARIFFEFLFLGGQDYYGFCQYCNKFFVVHRKGRKKYCSDVCRATASKERNLSK